MNHLLASALMLGQLLAETPPDNPLFVRLYLAIHRIGYLHRVLKAASEVV